MIVPDIALVQHLTEVESVAIKKTRNQKYGMLIKPKLARLLRHFQKNSKKNQMAADTNEAKMWLTRLATKVKENLVMNPTKYSTMPTNT